MFLMIISIRNNNVQYKNFVRWQITVLWYKVHNIFKKYTAIAVSEN